jgi:hypothetical protein
MQFTAEYPGYLQREIERVTGGTAVYLGGAVDAYLTIISIMDMPCS